MKPQHVIRWMAAGGAVLVACMILMGLSAPMNVSSQGLPTPTIPGKGDPLPTTVPPPSEIVLDGRPHFVDFYAYWCGPCLDMRPYVTRMEARFAEQINFWLVDVDDPASTPLEQRFGGVPFIPLVILLDAEGREVNRLEGFQTERQLERALQALLDQSGSGLPAIPGKGGPVITPTPVPDVPPGKR
jgi:thioredoxin 1